jgi:hypothetical protein
MQSICPKVLETLQDITRNVKIQDFRIIHPNYKPLELPEDAIARFRKLPTSLQNKYHILQLQSFIYGIYYNGSLQNQLVLSGSDNLPTTLENNRVLGINKDFYNKIHEANRGTGYFDKNWSVIASYENGTSIVSKGSLQLHINPNKHLSEQEKSPKVGDLVSVLMPKNLIQEAYYIAVSNNEPETHDDMVRVYFNLEPEGAVKVMESLTQSLNDAALFFHFKVLYNPTEYSRSDSGVLYFEKNNYERVKPILQDIYNQHKAYLKPSTPLFTKQIAPGLGLAEEPNNKSHQQESFGTHRCNIISDAIIAAWHEGNDSPEYRMENIIQQFASLSIELAKPYLNPNSQDIYGTLQSQSSVINV